MTIHWFSDFAAGAIIGTAIGTVVGRSFSLGQMQARRFFPLLVRRTSVFETNMAFSRAMHRVIFHLDMDAFYASVEQRDNPTLRGKPVIVGAPPTQRGVVCAASYEARKFGVHSAMPSATAGRLCPKGIFVRPRMEAYKDESRQIMQLVAETGAVIEQMSIDEAYLDLSGLCQAEDADASLLQSRPAGTAVEADGFSRSGT